MLHAGAAEPAADLVLALERRGISARGAVVYRLIVSSLSEAELRNAARADFVLLHSAKAARAFRALDMAGPRPVCLSPAIAQALAAPATTAEWTNEDALLAALAGAAR